MPFSRGSSQPRDRTLVSYVSCIGRRVLSTSATYNSCLNKAYAPLIFSMRHITAFPHSGTRGTLQSYMWGSLLNSKSWPRPRKKKKKKTKTQQHGLKKTRDICLQNELKVKTSAGQLQLSSLSMSADEHENAAGVDLGITNTF